jgi:hypothetical protein
MSIASGTPQLTNAASRRSRTASVRIEPNASSAILLDEDNRPLTTYREPDLRM